MRTLVKFETSAGIRCYVNHRRVTWIVPGPTPADSIQVYTKIYTLGADEPTIVKGSLEWVANRLNGEE